MHLSRSVITNFKQLIGISDWSHEKKKLRKKFMKLFYHKKYTSEDIVNKMIEMGMCKGDVVCIHASMMEFYNFQGNAKELIEKIEDYLGEEGTLVMPAFPKNFSALKKKCLTKNYRGIGDEVCFDVNETPTGAGYLAETFRKMPGVLRSINLQHSVCAKGKMADYLLSEHHKSQTCWDEMSPYYKLALVNAKIFSLGLPQCVGTVIHCTESALYGKYPYYDQFFATEITYNYRDSNGNIGVHSMRTNSANRNPDKKLQIVKKYFANGEYMKDKISNLSIIKVNAEYTHNRFMELAKKGIVMYSEPDPKKYQWN